ncbi:MAG: hypothetical protein RL324_1850 [Verrucomicrobiota bacterium]|jgi:hypothetical protein
MPWPGFRIGSIPGPINPGHPAAFRRLRGDMQGTTGSQVIIEYTRLVSADRPEDAATS